MPYTAPDPQVCTDVSVRPQGTRPNFLGMSLSAVALRFRNMRAQVIWSDIDYADHYRMFTLDPVNFAAPDMRKFVEE